ncbi:MAG: SUMF1/EgtB/PvdO family nonheme iron enzyme [Phycisphaerae bacterium]
MKCSFLALAATISLLATNSASALVNIDLVPVGNVGNVADTKVMNDGTTGYGQVNYAYNIGKYDVTAGQYTAFLNAVASTGDPKGLYNSDMGSGDPYFGCGIAQTYNSGTGTYSYTTTRNANYPVNYVSFLDGCRFTNWLQNNQPTGVNESVGTTETGAYDLTNPTAITNNTITRSTDATWAVASENEWYKAAYYDPHLNNNNGGYWLYPTKSNTAPNNTLSDAATNPNDANYNIRVFTDPTNYLTPVGTFGASPSAYGTFDQGGDVWQFNDTKFSYTYSDGRGLRGGSYNDNYVTLQSGYRTWATIIDEFDFIGFRVSQIPPPTTIIWTSPSSGSFDTAGNWDLQVMPNSSLNVVITPSGGLNVIGPSAPTTVKSLTIGSSTGLTQLSLQAGGTLTIIDGMTINSGGNINLPAGGKLIVLAATTDHTLIQIPTGGITVVIGSQLDLSNHDVIIAGAAANAAAFNDAIVAPQLAPKGIGGTPVYVTTGVLSGLEWNALHDSALFGGQAVVSTDLVLRYTIAGDTTLRGYIDATDFAQIDASYLKVLGGDTNSGFTWIQGDFNHDGKVDYQDFALIDFNYANQSGLLANAQILADSTRFGSDFTSYYASLSASVPEPSSITMIALGGIALLSRRRKSV